MTSVPEADLEHILTHTRGVWEAMRGRNLFITGGTGFFGRWLLESFAFVNERLGLGADATILTRDPEAIAAKAPRLAANGNIHFVRGDVRRLERKGIVSQLPRGHSGEFPFFIHAATESGSSLGKDDPLAMFDTIVTGTRAALDFAAASGTGPFLLTSSGAVYGTQPSEITHIAENFSGGPDCTRPGSAYGEGKRAAEVLCACYHERHPGLEPVIARCFAFVGPLLPLDVHFAVGNFIRDAMRGGPIKIGGDGTPHRSYLYAADLTVWLWTLLFTGEAMRPYNVGSEEDVTILELAKTVAGCFCENVEITVAQEPRPGVPPARYVPSARRATELGLATRIPLAEAIARTIAWHSPASKLHAPPF